MALMTPFFVPYFLHVCQLARINAWKIWCFEK